MPIISMFYGIIIAYTSSIIRITTSRTSMRNTPSSRHPWALKMERFSLVSCLASN